MNLSDQQDTARTTTHSRLLQASLSEKTGCILYTFLWTFPRVILPEVNTHRMLSRNTSSSRAIPTRKQLERIINDPFIPQFIGTNQKGMQAGNDFEDLDLKLRQFSYGMARFPAAGAAWLLSKLGVHKQIANRLLEPWMWTNQLVSATDLDNLFYLRNHYMSEPHFHKLAAQAYKQANTAKHALLTSSGKLRVRNVVMGERILLNEEWNTTLRVTHLGQWHLPFILEADTDSYTLEDLKRISAARCARLSYYQHGTRETNVEADLALFDRLAGSNPKHLSPLEHQATPLTVGVYEGNFKGWKQFRKEIPNEGGPKDWI